MRDPDWKNGPDDEDDTEVVATREPGGTPSVELYKVLGPEGRPCNGGTGVWSLPTEDEPGAWMPAVRVYPCRSGYHLCRAGDLIERLGPEIYVAEGRGEHEECDNEIVYAEARLIRRLEAWDDRAARLFAADCAARVLELFERELPDDDRPRKAIETAWSCARGEIDESARVAAGEAAGEAAREAAWAARAAAWAARAAAWAAGEATWAAAREATWAARVAAGEAAREAGVAAGVAAWAAWKSAGEAAREAERRWQTQHLMCILGLEVTP